MNQHLFRHGECVCGIKEGSLKAAFSCAGPMILSGDDVEPDHVRLERAMGELHVAREERDIARADYRKVFDSWTESRERHLKAEAEVIRLTTERDAENRVGRNCTELLTKAHWTLKQVRIITRRQIYHGTFDVDSAWHHLLRLTTEVLGEEKDGGVLR